MNTKQGMILIDILLALSLATIFTAIVTESSLGARQVFDKANERADLLDAYESSAASSSKLFGNDRIETDISSFIKVNARDPLHIADSAGTPICSVDFSDKNVAVSITPIMLPINSLLPLTDLQVRNGIAYVSDDSSTASDPDLFIVDFKDRNNPKVLSSINTGPGIAAFAIAGARIYAAAASAVSQLHVIRMDSLNSLALESKYKLPPPYATATEPIGSSIFFDKDKIYLGTEKWDGDEFSVIDVSNPTALIKIGGLETGSKVNGIFVRDGLAYVADSDEKQLRVVDVSQSSTPILTDSFSPSGWSRQEGKRISSFEGALDFGRTSGGYNIINDHEALEWAAASSSLSMITSPSHSLDIPGGVYGIVADRFHLYLATRQVNKEFQIFDHSLSTTTALAYSLPVAPQTLTCDGDHLYILAATAPVIYEISFN
jgi:type II secretory pathway pseudopilin PulG